MGCLRFFGLLLWKNWLLQKRKKVLTFFEIFLPVLFAGEWCVCVCVCVYVYVCVVVTRKVSLPGRSQVRVQGVLGGTMCGWV